MKIFSGYKTNGLFWFRFFGYGLHGKDTTKNRLLFSERNGYRKYLKIGNWIFRFIKS